MSKRIYWMEMEVGCMVVTGEGCKVRVWRVLLLPHSSYMSLAKLLNNLWPQFLSSVEWI